MNIPGLELGALCCTSTLDMYHVFWTLFIRDIDMVWVKSAYLLDNFQQQVSLRQVQIVLLKWLSFSFHQNTKRSQQLFISRILSIWGNWAKDHSHFAFDIVKNIMLWVKSTHFWLTTASFTEANINTLFKWLSFRFPQPTKRP